MQFFLIYVALPCLFYRLISDKPLDELLNPTFILATTACTATAFALALLVGLRSARGDLAQGVMQGVAGSYSNIGYMGPPLVLSAIGAQASAPVVLIFVFDSLFLFSAVPFLMALAGRERRSLSATAREVAWRVATHPFNIADRGRRRGELLPRAAARGARQDDRVALGAAAPCALFLLGSRWRSSPSGGCPPRCRCWR
jgi:predicted permease